MLDTRLVLRRPGKRPAGGILSALAVLLAALALGSALQAQGGPRGPKRGGPPRSGPAGIAPTLPAPSLWPRLADEVVAAWLERNPDRAFELARPEATTLHLGTFGTSASLRWRQTLTDALARLERCDRTGTPALERVRMQTFQDWLEAELLQLDGLAPSAADPYGYVQRALRTLRAVNEAPWLDAETRRATREALVAELPAYFADARLSLVSPSPTAIDLALENLTDLEELVRAIEAEKPSAAAPRPEERAPVPSAPNASPGTRAKAAPRGSDKSGARAERTQLSDGPARKGTRALPRPAPPPRETTARESLESFRHWLLELGARAGGPLSHLDSDRWSRLVRLATGSPRQTIEIKLGCLRELARLDLSMRDVPGRSKHELETDRLAARTATAATWALGLGKKANILPENLKAGSLSFETEESDRTAVRRVELRPGPEDTLRVCLQLPNEAWIPARTAARSRGLMSVQQAALGVRYGLAGEALIEKTRRASSEALPVLLENRSVREGFGLFAQDWLARAAWIENPLREDADLMREFEFQRGVEAARLLATLEVHAEGLTLEEVALGFQRRTGLDPETARAEARAAQRDPLHGIGYLGLLELRALEERMAAVSTPRKGLRLAVLLSLRNPELRPAELTLGELPEELAEADPGEKAEGGVPENPGRSQKGRSRSR